MKLEEQLTQELRGTIEAAKQRDYVPTYFLRMLEQYRGLETAKRLLASSEPQTGLFELYDRGLLADSMEAIVLKEKYEELFTDQELAEARARLEQLGYFDNR